MATNPTRRTFLSGASLVLPDRVVSGHTLVLEAGRIVDLISGPRETAPDEVRVNLDDHFVVPGFIDVHVHGVLGTDVLDGDASVRRVAERLPRWGVTAFCPTSVACPPDVLDRFLREVAELRQTTTPGAPRSRVLPAHLESNFINPEYHGAQPPGCLRVPADTAAGAGVRSHPSPSASRDDFTTGDILNVIDRFRADIATVTLAPEIPGGLGLTRVSAHRSRSPAKEVKP